MGVKREGNETAEGRIGVSFDNAAKVGAIVEMRCESAPSAKSDQFIALANDLAKHVATSKAADVPAMLVEPFGGKGTVQDRINDVGRRDPREDDPPQVPAARGRRLRRVRPPRRHRRRAGRVQGRRGERRAAPRRGRAHRGAQPAVRDHRGRARRRDGQGEGAREGGHRRRPEERRQAREHPREDRRGQAADEARRDRADASSRWRTT